MPYDQIRAKLDSALTSVFTEDGKRAVLYYMTEKYSLTLEQASRDPGKLETALTNLLGEIGWTVVKRRILEQFYGPSIGIDMVTVESASLRDAFGMIGSFMAFLGPSP
jgi:glycosyltransferase A (GT-A) superfamily protein (DUF2064 family)